MARSSRHQAHASSATEAGGYQRRRPEQTALYRCIAQHWPTFREQAEEAGGLPRFVVREFEEYLRCGLLEHGCLRLACRKCGFERLVALSCKRRGFCPSCLARRMSDTAVHLEQRVLPEVPLRQWVCSLPWRLRYLCGYDRQLCAEVVGAFVNEVMRSLRHRAKRVLGLDSVQQAHCGAVTFVQRFDSALRLNVHPHTLALDGVYVRGADGHLVFHSLPEPSADEVADVAVRTARRVGRVLERQGRSLEGLVEGASDADGEHDSFGAEQLALASCYGAATRGVGLFGTRAGAPTLRLVRPELGRQSEPAAKVLGFDVHAKVAFDGRDRKRVERLCRYLGRPPIAQDRLTELEDGRFRYSMKKPWTDGTVALTFEPLDLIARLCAMVPPPGFHTVRYHGVLSSHASLRTEVVPEPPVEQDPTPSPQLELLELLERQDDHEARPSRKPWAWLLRHVFREDVSVCPKCAGPMRWLEVATSKEAIERLVARHDPCRASNSAPAPRCSRAPPAQLSLPLPCA